MKSGLEKVFRASAAGGGAFGTMAWTDFQTGVVGVLLTQTPSAQVPEWSRLFYPALEKAGYGRMVNESPLTELGR